MSRNRWVLLIGMNDLSKARSCILPSWPTTFYIIYVMGTKTIRNIYEILRRYWQISEKSHSFAIYKSWKIRCISRTVYFQRWESNEVKHFAKAFLKHLSNLKANCSDTIMFSSRMFAQESWNWHLIVVDP